MAHDLAGEHTQQVWLTDSELELVLKAVRLYQNQLLDWTLPATRERAERLRARLEEIVG